MRATFGGLVVLVAVALSACAAPMKTTSNGVSGFTGPPVPAATTGIPAVGAGGDPSAGYNTVDLVFLQQMIPHHLQSMQMTSWAPSRGASPEIQQIAAAQQAALPPEVQTMGRSLMSLGLQVPTDPGGHQHAGMTQADVTRLGTLSGKDFDTDFLALWNKHLLASVDMARAESQQGFNTGTRDLAASIARRDSAQVLALIKIAS